MLDGPRWQEQLVEAPVGQLDGLNLGDLRIDGFPEAPLVTNSIDHSQGWGVTFEPLPPMSTAATDT